MSVTVTLFKGISPNYGKHYKFFTSYAEYIDSLGNYYKRYTLTDDRISDNQIIFSAAENVDAAEVSYCYIDRNDGNSNQAYYFYHVTSGSVRGGMAFLQIELDVWATYLQRVNFGEIYVERCNRAILPHGQYDMPDFTINTPDYITIGNFTATNETLAIIYLCAFKSAISLFDNSLTNVALFGNPLNEITTPGSIYEERSFENLTAFIGGVYGVHRTVATFDYTTDAAVLGAWIVPLEVIDGAGAGTDTVLKSKCEFGELNFSPRLICRPQIFTKNISIQTDPYHLQSVGTRLESMILPRDTSVLTVQYQFVTKKDGISVFVCCGNKVLDITKSFQLTLTTANDGYNTGEKIAKALELVRVGASASGGGLSFATNAAGYIASKFSDVSPRITSGDAASTFYNKSNVNYKSPYILTKYTFNASNTTIGYTIRNNGAIFNSIYTQGLGNILNSALMGIGPPNSTYIQGDIDCYGAQKDIIDFFVQRFRDGVYLEKV